MLVGQPVEVVTSVNFRLIGRVGILREVVGAERCKVEFDMDPLIDDHGMEVIGNKYYRYMHNICLREVVSVVILSKKIKPIVSSIFLTEDKKIVKLKNIESKKENMVINGYYCGKLFIEI